ncbi:MAG: cupin domain-containing protein [Gammaproteobacteria bacterium]|nr:cupin domain-containing protein [Gammaproteobacteria bacterium]
MNDTLSSAQIQAGEIVLPCTELDATLRFFTDSLGFRIDAVFPADAPAVANISGYGLRVRLQVGADGALGALRLTCREPDSVAAGERILDAPNGTRIELVSAESPMVLPPQQQSFVVHRVDDDADWGVGRAGMLYRDLIPDRQGGRFIASHIRIPDGGPVPDYVHFHKIRWQMIYCYKGWVRLVYQDQGEPFVMRAGDCVLQPPEIRHRVLECSPGLEVVEIGSPAEHMTCVDHDLELPTAVVDPHRDFGGQRFVHHVAAAAQWRPWRLPGFEARDLGIADATSGLAGVQVARAAHATQMPPPVAHDGEFMFLFVLQGELSLHTGAHGTQRLTAGDACVIPAGLPYAVASAVKNAELLDVTFPPDRP